VCPQEEFHVHFFTEPAVFVPIVSFVLTRALDGPRYPAVRSAYLLESFRCVRGWVLVGMILQRQFLVRILHFLKGGCLRDGLPEMRYIVYTTKIYVQVKGQSIYIRITKLKKRRVRFGNNFCASAVGCDVFEGCKTDLRETESLVSVCEIDLAHFHDRPLGARRWQVQRLRQRPAH